jgi:diadenosine tetraphosphate (Ap4A) HIT family hydrolase
MKCFLCDLDLSVLVAQNALAVAVRDSFPVNPGHTLVITRRHVASWFETAHGERVAVLGLVDEVERQLTRELSPDGFNVGFNVGEAAGQTVPHLHVHVIPRFSGDVDDPTGGVRLVVPERGNYRRPGYIPRSAGPKR